MFCVTITSNVAPRFSAAALPPSYEAWLKDLSSSCPTSVTTPIFSDSPDGPPPPQAASIIEAMMRAAVIKYSFFIFSSPLEEYGFEWLAFQQAQPYDFASINPLFLLCKPAQVSTVSEGVHLFGHFHR